MIIKKVVSNIKKLIPISNEKFIAQLRAKGAKIGDNTIFFSPRKTIVDEGKAFLISIGSYCKITSGVTILAHDYSRSVLRYCYGENIGGSSPVKIGNNCFIGINAIILMGSKIGDNCIIGAGSVVKGTFPANSVIAGNPAKIICNLEDFLNKRKKRVLQEACDCVLACKENTGKLPTINQMGDGFAWLYTPHNQETIEKYPNFFNLVGDDCDNIRESFLRTVPLFDSFEDFLTFAESNITNDNNNFFNSDI